MSDLEPRDESTLKLYITPEHPCSYLPEREAKTLFADPHANNSPALYQMLINMGFRRSGGMIYRPECNGCRACIPARIPVALFTPNRSQRRSWRSCREQLQIRVLPDRFEAEHYALYETYIQSRHPDGDMADTSVEKYLDFLCCSWNDTRFVEFSTVEGVVAVAVCDLLPHGISAVYTFFDPAIARMSPGVFALMWQVEQARILGKPWVYLGYWIPECPKMAYKSQYRPLEIYQDERWQRLDPDNPPLLSQLTRLESLK